jgi:hypothetical protein
MLRIEFCTPAMLRIRQSWNKQFEPDEPWMVVQYNWGEVPVQQTELKDHYLLRSADLQVKLYKTGLRIDVLTKGGKLLSSESLGGRKNGA